MTSLWIICTAERGHPPPSSSFQFKCLLHLKNLSANFLILMLWKVVASLFITSVMGADGFSEGLEIASWGWVEKPAVWKSESGKTGAVQTPPVLSNVCHALLVAIIYYWNYQQTWSNFDLAVAHSLAPLSLPTSAWRELVQHQLLQGLCRWGH